MLLAVEGHARWKGSAEAEQRRWWLDVCLSRYELCTLFESCTSLAYVKMHLRVCSKACASYEAASADFTPERASRLLLRSSLEQEEKKVGDTTC